MLTTNFAFEAKDGNWWINDDLYYQSGAGKTSVVYYHYYSQRTKAVKLFIFGITINYTILIVNCD